MFIAGLVYEKLENCGRFSGKEAIGKKNISIGGLRKNVLEHNHLVKHVHRSGEWHAKKFI